VLHYWHCDLNLRHRQSNWQHSTSTTRDSNSSCYTVLTPRGRRLLQTLINADTFILKMQALRSVVTSVECDRNLAALRRKMISVALAGLIRRSFQRGWLRTAIQRLSCCGARVWPNSTAVLHGIAYCTMALCKLGNNRVFCSNGRK